LATAPPPPTTINQGNDLAEAMQPCLLLVEHPFTSRVIFVCVILSTINLSLEHSPTICLVPNGQVDGVAPPDGTPCIIQAMDPAYGVKTPLQHLLDAGDNIFFLVFAVEVGATDIGRSHLKLFPFSTTAGTVHV
jgi:hypothetical protein